MIFIIPPPRHITFPALYIYVRLKGGYVQIKRRFKEIAAVGAARYCDECFDEE